jgi:hypothetical protein
MRKLVHGAALMISVACRAFCGDTDQHFDVSLFSSRPIDLSPYYQAVISEATETYRGDAVGHIVVRRYTFVGSLLSKQIDTPLVRAPSELERGFNPFPSEPFTLRLTSRPEDQMRLP